jgi:hypothetical protein
MESRQCSWCSNYFSDGGYYHEIDENGKKYKSKQRFCCAKCSHDYPYKVTPDKSDENGELLKILAFIIFMIFAFYATCKRQ